MKVWYVQIQYQGWRTGRNEIQVTLNMVKGLANKKQRMWYYVFPATNGTLFLIKVL